MKKELLKLGTKIFTLLTVLLTTQSVSFSQTNPCDIPLVVDIQSQDPLCYGENSGWINVDISGGVPYKQ